MQNRGAKSTINSSLLFSSLLFSCSSLALLLLLHLLLHAPLTARPSRNAVKQCEGESAGYLLPSAYA